MTKKLTQSPNMTNLPREQMFTTEPETKDKSYIVSGYRLSDIAHPEITKKQFEEIEEITGKSVTKAVLVHNLSIFGTLLPLPADYALGDASDPNNWVKKIFGLQSFFSERSNKEAKGVLRFNFRSIIIGMCVCSNNSTGHSICNTKNNSIDYAGKERICVVPNFGPYIESVKQIFYSNCEKMNIKIPPKFNEPQVFLI